jgi:hypothetical protein
MMQLHPVPMKRAKRLALAALGKLHGVVAAPSSAFTARRSIIERD